ncbi:DUF819 family protein [Facklamia hominis]
MNSLIHADNIWALWAIIAGCATIAIVLEQKYDWASKVTGAIIALVMMLVLSNVGVIPTSSPVYDAVWDYIVPLALPMLLFTADLKSIKQGAGRLMLIFLLSSLGTIVGGVLAYFLLRDLIPQLNDIVPMFIGTYIGGGVNFVALSTAYKVPAATTSAAMVADNLLMALYFFVLITLPGLKWIQYHYSHPHMDKLTEMTTEDRSASDTMAAKYWSPKDISLKDIALTVSLSLVIVALSSTLANYIGRCFTGQDFWSVVLRSFFGNKYLLITTFTILLASLCPKWMQSIHGSQELGTFLIYLFFAVIGAPASVPLILSESPLLLLFAAIMVFTNLLWTLLCGKLFKFSIEEIIVSSNANIGGPTTAAAMAVSKGWGDLIVPALLVGTLGYVVGNYLGVLLGILLH